MLLSGTIGDIPELAVTAKPGGSVLTEAFISGLPVSLGERSPTVLDRQLLSLLHTPSLLAVPVKGGDNCPGVFALGTDNDHLPTTLELADIFTHQLASVLANRTAAGAAADTGTEGLDQEIARDRLRKQVHEVSNPLTIIRQYIYQLRGRLEDAGVQQELDVIRDELDRAGNLLLQMSHTDNSQHGDDGVELSAELESLARILEDSLFSSANRNLKLSLCSEPTRVTAGATRIRQVVINLVRNAAESLPDDGGTVEIHTSAPVWQNHRTWVELEVKDTGRGIPGEIRDTLFAPVKTTKGEGHSGLGLSIVKQLVDDMEGIIACRTGQEGTTFRILFPAASHKKNETD